MKKKLAIIFWVVSVLISRPAAAQTKPVQFADIQPRLEAILSDLSSNMDQFENIQKKMEESARANENYNEQKNILLSSMIAITTISAICDYETDLLTLFIDLREKNRRKFYDVRIESLETAVKQIQIMYRQVQINYTILPANFFELPLVRKERTAILSTIESFNQMIELLKSVNQRE